MVLRAGPARKDSRTRTNSRWVDYMFARIAQKVIKDARSSSSEICSGRGTKTPRASSAERKRKSPAPLISEAIVGTLSCLPTDQLASRGLGELLHGARRPFSSSALTNLSWRLKMKWNSPKIVEVPVGMEINMYACANRNSATKTG